MRVRRKLLAQPSSKAVEARSTRWATSPMSTSTRSPVGSSLSTAWPSGSPRTSRRPTPSRRRSTSKEVARASRAGSSIHRSARSVVRARRARPQTRARPRSSSRCTRATTGCVGAGRMGVAGYTVDLPPVDTSSFLQPLSTARRPRATRCSRSTSRAQKADTDETRIDVLRTEGVLPSRGARHREDALKTLLFDLRREAITALVPALAASVLDWADHRRRDGELLFHDLLVLAAMRSVTTTCVRHVTRPTSAS